MKSTFRGESPKFRGILAIFPKFRGGQKNLSGNTAENKSGSTK